jgi:hypothetical protein
MRIIRKLIAALRVWERAADEEFATMDQATRAEVIDFINKSTY